MPSEPETVAVHTRKRAARSGANGLARYVVEGGAEEPAVHPAIEAAALRAKRQANPFHAEVLQRAGRISRLLPETGVEASIGPAGSLELHTVVGVTHIEMNIGPGEKGYDIFLSKQPDADEEHFDAPQALVAKLFERARAEAH